MKFSDLPAKGSITIKGDEYDWEKYTDKCLMLTRMDWSDYGNPLEVEITFPSADAEMDYNMIRDEWAGGIAEIDQDGDYIEHEPEYIEYFGDFFDHFAATNGAAQD